MRSRLLVALLLAASTTSANAYACVQEKKDQRVIALMKSAVEKMEVSELPMLCRFNVRYPNVGVSTKGGVHFVYYSIDVLPRLTDTELEAVFAHELAHIKLGHLRVRVLAPAASLEQEKDADRLAAHAVGPQAAQQGLLAIYKLVSDFIGKQKGTWVESTLVETAKVVQERLLLLDSRYAKSPFYQK